MLFIYSAKYVIITFHCKSASTVLVNLYCISITSVLTISYVTMFSACGCEKICQALRESGDPGSSKMCIKIYYKLKLSTTI